jgi:glycosyltransferase involved in cell wall biosynthesis
VTCAVIIPTLRRPDGLARALLSVFAQGEPRLQEICVVDNDPQGSAAPVLEALGARTPAPLLYVHEPKPGVATARNAGVRVTRAPLIAWLDDDEEATPGWLTALIDSRKRFEADVVFGPIEGRTPDASRRLRPYLDRFFSRIGPEASRPISLTYGCGNSLMRRESVLQGPCPFAEQHNEIGGEDDVLFSRLAARGAHFAWAAEAKVLEYAPRHRARLNYALGRAFAYGQGPSRDAVRRGRRLGLARSMALGAGQALVMGPAGAAALAVGAPVAPRLLEGAARGLGKVFWQDRFDQKRYGKAALSRDAA